MKKTSPFQERRRLTSLGEVVAQRLQDLGKPIVANHEIFAIVLQVYQQGAAKYLRSTHPTREAFSRVRHLLAVENIIRSDHDYGNHWRVSEVSDAPADEIVCAADPYCYISHMSAMQRYGLTDRRPEALFITKPPRPQERKLAILEMRQLYGDALDDPEVYTELIYLTHHPSTVRKRLINETHSTYYSDNLHVRGEHTRVATIGQTFLDMVERPERCGGMIHILSVWSLHASKYIEEIIKSIEYSPKKIHKIRAGYILEELAGIHDNRISAWKMYAQRGGSRVLDPTRPYMNNFSESWMLSLNVG